MLVEIGTSLCKASEMTREELMWLNDYLSFSIDGAWFSKAYKRGHWDGCIRMFNKKTGLFPVGLFRMVKKAAKEEGFLVEARSQRRPPCQLDQSVDTSWLRGYQKTALNHAVMYENGLLWMATGSGKTEVLAALVASLKTRWLFVVHRKGLMHDAAARIEKRTGIVCGKIGDGHKDLDHRVTVSTFQTLNIGLVGKKNKKTRKLIVKPDPKIKEFLAQQGGMVCDEAHTTAAETFYNVAMAAKNAYWRIGLSGTPLARGDKKSIYTVACLGPVIWRLRADTLIDAGYLAKPLIKMIEVEQYSDKPTWQGVYGDLIVRSKERNRIICKMACAAEKPSLLFVKQVQHGRDITKMLQRCGLNAAFVWGEKGTMQRQEAVKALERADLDVLVCSVIFQEGVDIPSLRSVIMAAGGKSIIATLQKIGRGMRRSDGKEEFEVWDVLDKGNEWIKKQAQKRKKTYESEHYTVHMITEKNLEHSNE